MLSLGLVGLLFLATSASAQSRPAAQILRDFDGVEYPSFSDGSDPESLARFNRAIESAAAKQEELALELLRSHPGHARVPEVMTTRWTLFCTVSHDGARVLEETKPYLDAETTPALRKAAVAARGRAALETDLPLEEKSRIVLEGLSEAPGDDYAASAAFQLLKYHTADPRLQRKILDEIERHPSDDAATREWVAGDAKSLRRLLDRVGKPVEFELSHVRSAIDEELPASTRELWGRPFLLHIASPWGAEPQASENAPLRRFQERFGASGLRVVSMQEEFEKLDESLLKSEFDLGETPLLLLVDRSGALAAFSFRVGPLERELDRLLGKPKRRPV